MRPDGRRLALIGLCLVGLIVSGAVHAQTGYGSAAGIEPPGKESALRRFEIITLTALPFTAIHSYAVARAIKIARERTFAADLEGSDWNYVGLGAAAFAVGIGIYDYLKMRGKDRNAPLLPEPPPAPEMPTPSSGLSGEPPLVALSWRF